MTALKMATRLDVKTTALFLCDMQTRFVQAIHAFEAVEATSQKLLKAAHILDVPVFTTEQAPKALGNTIPSLLSLPQHAYSQLEPKTRFSMLLPDVTEKWLAGAPNGGIKSVVLCGIESHVCVLQTALDLLERGVGVCVVADGVSSCNRAEVPIALARMKQAGAQIATSESILFELVGDAADPRFKQISVLIKQEKERTVDTLTALAPSGGDEGCTVA